MDLAHNKLKDGGVLAMVLPFAFAQGKSWQAARNALHDGYGDAHVISIATTGSTARASRLHCNLDFRLNSQSLAMCLTPQKCLGGRAWPNVICEDPRHELPLLLWANSTLGLILFWWRGTRQQEGRALLTITSVPELPVLDTRVLNEQQLAHCAGLFEEFRHREFLPANEAYRDQTRKDLDRALLFGITSVLQLDPDLEENLDLLREQWCAEPSVHGGKSTRIRTIS